MSDTIDKVKIFEACIKRQNELIENYTQELAELDEEMNSRDHSPSQTDHNLAAERQEMYQALKKELDFLKYEMQILRNLDMEKTYESVSLGAVVVTDKRTFFVSVSIEEVEIGDNKVFGLSMEAPIYNKMKDKSKGDTFEMNGLEYKVLDVY